MIQKAHSLRSEAAASFEIRLRCITWGETRSHEEVKNAFCLIFNTEVLLNTSIKYVSRE